MRAQEETQLQISLCLPGLKALSPDPSNHNSQTPMEPTRCLVCPSIISCLHPWVSIFSIFSSLILSWMQLCIQKRIKRHFLPWISGSFQVVMWHFAKNRIHNCVLCIYTQEFKNCMVKQGFRFEIEAERKDWD